MEIKKKDEKGEKKKKNENKILVCGLVSGILTKTLFAPFDRIKLFYQIQPMFYHYSEVRRKIQNTKKKYFKDRKKYISKNLLSNGLDKTEKKHFSSTSYSLNINKLVLNENVVFRNFKNCLNEIIKNSRPKNSKPQNSENINSESTHRKKGLKHERTHHDKRRNYNDASKTSLHQVFKKIYFYNNKNKLQLNNISKNYTLLNINANVRNTLRNKIMCLNTAKTARQPIKYQNIMQSFLFIIKEEGILGLWKGNLINTLRGGIVYSAKFGTNDIIKERYKKKKKKKEEKRVDILIKSATNKKSDTNNSVKKNEQKFNYYESVIAGYASGIIQKTISYPLDLLSIRVALGVNEKYLRNNNTLLYKKKSIFNIIREISINEGITGFFKGYVPTLLTGVPYVTLQMLFFDFYKNIFQNYFPHTSNSLSSIAFCSSVSGSLSNLSSLIIVFPGDTVRKRMMNNGIDNKNYIYKNTFHCIKNIYYLEGLRNFYYGLFPSMLKSVPSGAIQFMSYEILKYMISQK
ncbi:mitochondrial carrier protein [Plasmodium brasilianum]|uniref:Mitochondrial carrier protein, putative n=2 Tax=Plasmodium (Plasmodium) TaxID=418103 RepID=A0A1A8W4M8_PLAMA|nr:mitochondrial carrier protein, putative [Plasmodium malariae]KAI4837047.1 mitochondrial carrier protein [Plasmodium brasilianum]SBS86627.1 mitochondrial carrier protein, putative [Plasmodium malariae]SCO92924.1 mitochondrial carrier protein, putative [Plasmodium malariae]